MTTTTSDDSAINATDTFTGADVTDHTVIEMLHSELGPSAAPRWLNCPGSVLASRGVTKKDSIFAAEGNAAHDLSEWCRVQNTDASTFLGHTIKVGEFEFTVDQEMVDGIDMFVEYVENLPGDRLIEEMIHYDEWVPNGFGTLDDARLNDGNIYVTDLKYGKGVQVFAEDSDQLKIYALGLYHDYKHLYIFDKFILAIHQPRLDHVETFEITLSDLLKWADEVVRPTAEIALKPGAPFKAGNHCTFCPIRNTCKVREQYVLEAALDDFTDLDSDLRMIEFMTNDELGRLLPRIPAIKKWCNDMLAYARSEVAAGNPVVNPETGPYKFVEGRSLRAWKLAEDEVADVLMLEVDDPDAIWNKKLVSPAQAEKKFGKGKLDHLIHKPQGKPVLVPGTDKRESLAIDPETEFGDVDDD